MAWGDKDNKERVPTRYMATIVWFFYETGDCGTAPNIGNVADLFKVSTSQLSRLIMAKKLKSGPGSYVPRKRRMVTEDEPSGSVIKLTTGQEQEDDKLERYLVL